MRTVLRLTLGLAVVALVAATGASPQPMAGIAVNAAPPGVALGSINASSGIVSYDLFAVARWSPGAHGVEGAFYVTDLTEGGTRSIGFPIDVTAEERSSDVKRTSYAGLIGNKYRVRVHWRVYNPGGASGERDSTPKTFGGEKKEPVPRFAPSSKDKLFFAQLAVGSASAAALAFGAIALVGTPVGAALLVVAAVGMLVTWKMNKAGRDPVDLRFRAIAKPRIPPAPKVSPGQGLSVGGAKALNQLFALQVQEIGLWQAILTAFDRSQGAHVKKAVDWEQKQVRAAGGYATRLSGVLLAEAKLRPKLETALALGDVSLSGDDVRAYEESWITKGLPATFTNVLAKLSLTSAEQRDVRTLMLARDPFAYVGRPLTLADAQLLGSLRQLAADLKVFARKAASDPLETGL